jgi:predicted AAA+ superfamily ATPase
MALNTSYEQYKMFLCDTGLFVTLAFWDRDFTENVIYKQLLSNKLSANMGYVYENLVAQMLVAAGNKLFYYTFPKDNKHYYEIDFLISRGKKICPIEVKSGNYRTHASLDNFIDKFTDRIERPYILHAKDTEKKGHILCLPIYMTPLL